MVHNGTVNPKMMIITLTQKWWLLHYLAQHYSKHSEYEDCSKLLELSDMEYFLEW